MTSPDNLPSITIITPSFRQAQFIERTIQSVLNQNYPHLEYLIIDGGSTDGTVEIIKKYEDRIAFWSSAKDEGQSDAINKGLTRATGEIVGWLNSDDTFAPGALHAIGRYYAGHSDAEFLYGHTNLIDANDNITRRLLAVPTNAIELLRFNRNLFSQPGTTWRRKLQDRVGLLDRSLHFTMDCDFYVRAAKATRLHHLPVHLANLRIHGETKSETNRDKFEKEQQALGQRHGVTEEYTTLRAKLFRLQRIARILRQPANWGRIRGR